MSHRKNARRKPVLVAGLLLLVVALSWALPLRPAVAQGPIILDGVGDDWDQAWQVATDPLDVFITGSGLHPHEAPTYARSGYDAIALWAHYQSSDDRWYFRLDVDGRGGDSDSATGTAGNLGVGTHGDDQGPLFDPNLPFFDGTGLGNSEQYTLGFQCASGATGQTAGIANSTAILPGVVSATTTGTAGQGVYGTTVNPGIVEFGFDRQVLIPPAAVCSQLWLSAQIGDSNDMVSDDQVAATQVLALELMANCPEAPLVAGDEATFPLDYAIPASAQLGASDVVLTVEVPEGATFVSASDNGSESNGIITWQLGNLQPGDADQVTFTLRLPTLATLVTINSEISCAEGLRAQAEDTCPVQQPAPQPPPSPPAADTPPVVPEPGTVTLLLAGLGSLAGYATLQWRARRRQ